MTFVIFKAAGMAAAGKDETVRLGFGADEHGSEVCCTLQSNRRRALRSPKMNSAIAFGAAEWLLGFFGWR
jgi:hypothetical protein